MDSKHMALPARAMPSWRALATAALLCVLVGEVTSHGAGHSSALGVARSGGVAQGGRSSLPLAARASISAALGAESPAYRVSASGGAFQALGPGRRLSAHFERSGVELGAGPLMVGMSLRAIGYGAALTAQGDVSPTASANGVSYAYAQLSEWYVNGPLGLEQGFTIPRAPAAHPTGPLTLSMAISGDANAALSADGQSVTFSRAGVGSLRYAGLSASDARGRVLHSWLSVHAGRLLLMVDTRGARYPLRIDPLIQQGEKLTGAEEVGEGELGLSVVLSADGNTALIGGPRDDNFAGAAWVFARTGSTWTQQGPKLTAGEASAHLAPGECDEEKNEEGECAFGQSVALSGDGNTALVGAPGANGKAGAVWVFTRSGSSWTRREMLTGGEETREGHFGRSVALSANGETALIGGPGDSGHTGAAWVFVRSGLGWIQQGEKLTGAGEEGEGHFSRSVALSANGETAVIGGPGDSGHRGAVWVFTRSGSGWIQQGEKLTGAGESGEGRFGWSAALSGDGDTALIGARTDANGAGAAWAFINSGSSWIQQGEKLTGAEELGEGQFGYSVALSGDGATALIGAPHDHSFLGAVRLFTRSASTWTEQPEQLAGAGGAGKGWLGTGVALSGDGDTALIGASHDDGKVGGAWVFANGPAPAQPPTVSRISPKSGPPQGGTEVTISGTNFTTATAVHFGADSAASFTVQSATSIIAISPTEPEGTVGVSVTTLAGESEALGPEDQFKFVSETEEPEPGPELKHHQTNPDEGGSSSNDSTASSSSAPRTIAAASGGVLSFRGSGSTCSLALSSRKIIVQAHNRAALRFTRTGTGACADKLTLRLKTKRKGKRSRTTTIGSASFSLATGSSQLIKIELNAAGRAMLKAAHGRLRASLAIVRLSPAPTGTSTEAVLVVTGARRARSVH